jgi:hypothetical protein
MSRVPEEIRAEWPQTAARGTTSAPDADGFSREVAFEAGHPWNTRGNPPASNYGRASVKVRFLLHGPKGSVQFLWSTGITPESTIGRFGDEWMHTGPSGFDAGYHADEPQYPHQDAFPCTYRPSGQCYYDGSALAGDDMLRVFLTEGEDAMWAALQRRYIEWFETESEVR